jgi:hypothetical protein
MTRHAIYGAGLALAMLAGAAHAQPADPRCVLGAGSDPACPAGAILVTPQVEMQGRAPAAPPIAAPILRERPAPAPMRAAPAAPCTGQRCFYVIQDAQPAAPVLPAPMARYEPPVQSAPIVRYEPPMAQPAQPLVRYEAPQHVAQAYSAQRSTIVYAERKHGVVAAPLSAGSPCVIQAPPCGARVEETFDREVRLSPYFFGQAINNGVGFNTRDYYQSGGRIALVSGGSGRTFVSHSTTVVQTPPTVITINPQPAPCHSCH